MTMLSPKTRLNHMHNVPPIPISAETDATGYHHIPFADNDPRSDEPLVRISNSGLLGQSYYYETANNPPYNQRIAGSLPDLWCRQSVLQLLLTANHMLSDFGYALYIVDGYRPIATQRGLWQFFDNRVRAQHPSYTNAQIYKNVVTFVSDPNRFNPKDNTTWPTHSTGGAIDTMLFDQHNGQLADMGGHFDEMGDIALSDHFERALQAGTIDHTFPPLLHRRLLYHAMQQAGFVNYPMEFWHYDWGTQFYVYNAPANFTAIYGGEKPRFAWYGYIPLAHSNNT